MSMSLETCSLENTKRVLVVSNPQVREAIGHPSYHSSFELRVAGLTNDTQELRWAVRSGRNMYVEDLAFRFWNIDTYVTESTMEDPAFASSLHEHYDLNRLDAMAKTLRAMQGNAKLARSHRGAALGRWDLLRVWASAIGIREVWIPMWPTFHNYTAKYHLIVDLGSEKSVQVLKDLDYWVNEIACRERRGMTWDHREYLRFAEHYGYQTEA